MNGERSGKTPSATFTVGTRGILAPSQNLTRLGHLHNSYSLTCFNLARLSLNMQGVLMQGLAVFTLVQTGDNSAAMMWPALVFPFCESILLYVDSLRFGLLGDDWKLSTCHCITQLEAWKLQVRKRTVPHHR